MSSPEPQSFLPLPSADFHILVALSRAPLHGYGIMKSVEEESGGRVRVEVGSLYRMIGKLLSKDLIEKVASPDETPRPGQPRQFYGLTPLGSAVLRAEAHRLKETLALSRVQEILAEGDAS